MNTTALLVVVCTLLSGCIGLLILVGSLSRNSSGTPTFALLVNALQCGVG